MTNCTKKPQNDAVKPKNDAIELISKEDAINVVRKNHYRLQGKGMTEEVLVADLEALPSAQPVDKAYLCDWYINSVAESEPVWTEEHVLELVNDFYVIPKEKR